jgi:hypothetical protein
LNGRLADDENGVAGIPPIFHQSFSKEKIFDPRLFVVLFHVLDRQYTTQFTMSWSHQMYKPALFLQIFAIKYKILTR